MIQLPTDEAVAFDMLAILDVKLNHGLPVTSERARLWDALLSQLGDTANQVVRSASYEALLKSNAEVFDTIELAYRDAISASSVQRSNYARHIAKKALQQAFWSSPLLEVKTDPTS